MNDDDHYSRRRRRRRRRRRSSSSCCNRSSNNNRSSSSRSISSCRSSSSSSDSSSIRLRGCFRRRPPPFPDAAAPGACGPRTRSSRSATGGARPVGVSGRAVGRAATWNMTASSMEKRGQGAAPVAISTTVQPSDLPAGPESRAGRRRAARALVGCCAGGAFRARCRLQERGSVRR